MLSGDAGNPLTAVRGPTADTVGPCRIAETVVLADLSVNVFFRAVNQLGSLIMRTNASGARTDVEQYTEHGGVLQYPVAFDGQKSLISSVTSNSPESGITKLHLTSGLLTSGALKGMTLVVSVLDIDSNTLRVGRVVDNDTDDIWVLDDDSIGAAIYHHGAIQNGFVIYKQQDANEVLTSGSWDNVTTDGLTTDLIDTGVGSASAVGQWVSLPNGTWAEIISIPNSNTVRVNGDRTEIVAASDPYLIAKLPYTNLAYSTAGQWTGESFASGETTLTDSSATFASYMVGWQIILDMEFPVAQVITAVPSATTLKVAGDVRTLTDPGKFYILFAPPFVNPANGTLATIVTAGEDDDWYDVTGSQYLWAGYRYVPPMVGFNDGGTTKGAQAGNNKLGNYHCSRGIYSPYMGRFTTPGPSPNVGPNLSGDEPKGEPAKPKKKCCVKEASLTVGENPAKLKATRVVGGIQLYELRVEFSASVEFSNEGECKCECCEYRQAVKGSFKKDGKVSDHFIGHTPKVDEKGNVKKNAKGIPEVDPIKLSEDKFQEDAKAYFEEKNGKYEAKNAKYGYRNNMEEGTLDQSYSDNGCKYTMKHNPGYKNIQASNPAVKYEFSLTFKLTVVDICNGGEVSAAKGAGKNSIPIPHEFTVSGSGTK